MFVEVSFCCGGGGSPRLFSRLLPACSCFALRCAGTIETDQFTDAMLAYVHEKVRAQCAPAAVRRQGTMSEGGSSGMAAAAEEEEDEEEEMPEDLLTLSPEEQQKMIKRRGARLLKDHAALTVICCGVRPCCALTVICCGVRACEQRRR